MLISKE